jgi:site-specific recombinase XerD
MSHKTTAARRRENMSLELPQAVDYFCTSMTLEGKSPETVLWHRKKLPAFAQFLQQQGHSLKVKDVRVEDARAFIKSLLERKTRYNAHVLRKEVEGGLAMTTVHGYARSLRTFASWLEREGYTNENIFEGLKPPKLPQILIEPLAEDEIRKILLLIPQDTSEGVRSYAVVLLFLDSGIRLSELINLRISQIDFAVGQFKVFGKGAKERIVPMGVAARRAVIRYKDHFRPQPVNPNEDRLFLTMAGQPISKDSVEKLIQRLARKANIPRLHPHLLRHSFAVRYLINGGDVFTLQKILGHSTLDMTRRYVTLANSDVKDKHRQYSPIDNLGLAEHRRGRPKSLTSER